MPKSFHETHHAAWVNPDLAVMLCFWVLSKLFCPSPFILSIMSIILHGFHLYIYLYLNYASLKEIDPSSDTIPHGTKNEALFTFA